MNEETGDGGGETGEGRKFFNTSKDPFLSNAYVLTQKIKRKNLPSSVSRFMPSAGERPIRGGTFRYCRLLQCDADRCDC